MLANCAISLPALLLRVRTAGDSSASRSFFQEAVTSTFSHSSNISLQHFFTPCWIWSVFITFSFSGNRPSCTPISLHCGAYIGLTCRWRSFISGLLFTVNKTVANIISS